MVWDTKKAVIALPVAFPLYLIKFSFFDVPFNVVEVMVYLIFAYYFGKKIYHKFFTEDEGALRVFFRKIKGLFKIEVRDDETLQSVLKNKFSRFTLPVVLLLIGSVGGVVVSYLNGQAVLGLGIFKGWVVMPVLYSLLVVFALKDVSDKKKTLYFYVLSSLILSVWALYQVISRNFITIDGRASGPFESANYLALYVAPAVSLSFVMLWQRIENRIFGGLVTQENKFILFLRGLFKKENSSANYDSLMFAFEIISVVFISFALMYSRSYGGIIAAVSAILVYTVYELFFSYFKEKYGSFLKKIVILAAILVMVFTAAISQTGTGKARDFLKFDSQSSSSVRIQIWTVAFDFVKQEPIFGIGLGGFEKQYQDNASKILGVEPYEKTMLHAHNLILSSWLNAGILGMISILWLIVAVFLTSKTKLWTKFSVKEKRGMFLFIVMFIVVCVHGLVDQPFWKNDLALLWWMIVGGIV